MNGIKFSSTLPPLSTTTRRGGSTSRPSRRLLRVLKGALIAFLWLALVAAVEWKVMRDIGEGVIQPGPIAATHVAPEQAARRMAYHGTLVAYRCDRPSGWCFARDGKEVELW